jgi:RNA polymerase sigma-70 factor (sigma-E family)
MGYVRVVATWLTRPTLRTGVRVDQSFTDFVEQRSTHLLRTAYLLTGDRGHAEDLVQTALLRTAARWSNARDAPVAYVRQVLVNLARDGWRRRGRRPREEPLPEDHETVRGHDPGYDHLTQRRVVVHALRQLPVRQREVVVLRFFEDLSVEQTAELLGCTEGTVKSYTSRALARLRELLTDDLVEVPHAD